MPNDTGKYWREHPDERRAYQRAYYTRPDQRAKRAAWKREARRKWRLEIFERDGYTCIYCGVVQDADGLEVDHKIPRKYGGSNRRENLVTACADCNRHRGTTLFEQFMAQKRAELAALPAWVTETDVLDDTRELAYASA